MGLLLKFTLDVCHTVRQEQNWEDELYFIKRKISKLKKTRELKLYKIEIKIIYKIKIKIVCTFPLKKAYVSHNIFIKQFELREKDSKELKFQF